jgi:hypothetical protein
VGARRAIVHMYGPRRSSRCGRRWPDLKYGEHTSSACGAKKNFRAAQTALTLRTVLFTLHRLFPAMSKADNKPDREPIGPDDPLSATGMFLGGFQLQTDSSQAQEPASAKGAPLPPKQTPPFSPAPEGRGEFTQLFGTVNPLSTQSPSAAFSSPATATPSQSSGEVTRMFASPPAPPAERPAAGTAPANTPRMKGFSSPGASDSASAEGSFTQLFRTAPPVAARSPLQAQPSSSPPEVEKREWAPTFDPGPSSKGSGKESPGVTELFRALSATDGPQAVQNTERPLSFSNTRAGAPPAPPPTTPGDSFTVLIQRLTENTPPPQALETRQITPAASAPSGLGEYTRIIRRDEVKASSVAPVQQVAAEAKVQAPAVEPLKAAPTPAVASPAKSKLQELVPILLVLNAFLLVVVIVLVIFALARK